MEIAVPTVARWPDPCTGNWRDFLGSLITTMAECNAVTQASWKNCTVLYNVLIQNHTRYLEHISGSDLFRFCARLSRATVRTHSLTSIVMYINAIQVSHL